PAPPRIRENEIHVWRAQLDPEQALLPGLEAILAPEEKSLAGRFVFPRDRVHFVAAHGILRIILASYLRMPAKDVMFRYGPQKKPAIGLDHSESTVRFSLSHSHGLAVCAVARGREVGVDVEAIRPEVAGEDIAERFFSPRERAELRLLPPDRRVGGFFLCWTLKEAYIKARSVGLGIPLDSFDVSLMPGQPKGLISPDSDRCPLRYGRSAPHSRRACGPQPGGARRRAGICGVAAPRRCHHIACVAAPCICPPGACAKMHTLFSDGP